MGVHMQRAGILMAQGRHALALEELDRELESDPYSALAYANVALCRAKLGEFESALATAKRAISMVPDATETHYVLAAVHCQSGSLDDAKSSIDEAIRLDPRRPLNYSLLAVIMSNSKRWEECIEAADRGLALDPENLECANLRAFACVWMHKDDEAERTLKSALSLNPENPTTHGVLGVLRVMEANDEKAFEHLHESLRLNPNDPLSLSWLAELEGKVKRETGKRQAFLHVFMELMDGCFPWYLWMLFGGLGLFVIERFYAAAHGLLLFYLACLVGLGALRSISLGALLPVGKCWFIRREMDAQSAVAVVGGMISLGSLFAWITEGGGLMLPAVVFGLFMWQLSANWEAEPGRQRRAMVNVAGLLAMAGIVTICRNFAHYSPSRTHDESLQGLGPYLLAACAACLVGWLVLLGPHVPKQD